MRTDAVENDINKVPDERQMAELQKTCRGKAW